MVREIENIFRFIREVVSVKTKLERVMSHELKLESRDSLPHPPTSTQDQFSNQNATTRW